MDNMTPDTIITAELIANITCCQFCMSSVDSVGTHGKQFKCGSGAIIGETFSQNQTRECVLAERDFLRIRYDSVCAQIKDIVRQNCEKMNQIGNWAKSHGVNPDDHWNWVSVLSKVEENIKRNSGQNSFSA